MAMLAVQFARFVVCVSTNFQSRHSGMKLWDLTFRVDDNHIFGLLQFETRDRHEKIQVAGHFYIGSFISTDPITHETTFYHEFSGSRLPDRVVSTYIQQIDRSLKYVQFPTPSIYPSDD
jgi:hypothetical protein